MQIARVLVVDDEASIRDALQRALSPIYEVATARSGEHALEILHSQPIDLVLTDVRMPGIEGLELVRQVHELWPDLPCIVMTGYATPEHSVKALRAGAFWYLEKPIVAGFGEVVRALVAQAIEHGRLHHENRALQHQLGERSAFAHVIGRSPNFLQVLAQAERVAPTDSTVLLTGESGTGKEVLARAIHFASARAGKMLVEVNCGAIPEQLLESELFGHVKGAFTNASCSRQGRFALANGGTIFLDEIGDMSAALQVKLLRVLQERSFEPVGSSRTVRVDVRVIAATNQDLEQAIVDRRFREDLYYRLNVIPIRLPPLRERRTDIPLLIEHFLARSARERNLKITGFAPEALARLCEHEWPGNVRELENLLERLLIFAEGRSVELADLPAVVIGRSREDALVAPLLPEEGLDLHAHLQRIEADLILQALERTGWNKQRAATLLGTNRATLFAKIERAGIARQAVEHAVSRAG